MRDQDSRLIAEAYENVAHGPGKPYLDRVVQVFLQHGWKANAGTGTDPQGAAEKVSEDDPGVRIEVNFYFYPKTNTVQLFGTAYIQEGKYEREYPISKEEYAAPIDATLEQHVADFIADLDNNDLETKRMSPEEIQQDSEIERQEDMGDADR